MLQSPDIHPLFYRRGDRDREYNGFFEGDLIIKNQIWLQNLDLLLLMHLQSSSFL